MAHNFHFSSILPRWKSQPIPETKIEKENPHLTRVSFAKIQK